MEHEQKKTVQRREKTAAVKSRAAKNWRAACVWHSMWARRSEALRACSDRGYEQSGWCAACLRRPRNNRACCLQSGLWRVRRRSQRAAADFRGLAPPRPLGGLAGPVVAVRRSALALSRSRCRSRWQRCRMRRRDHWDRRERRERMLARAADLGGRILARAADLGRCTHGPSGLLLWRCQHRRQCRGRRRILARPPNLGGCTHGRRGCGLALSSGVQQGRHRRERMLAWPTNLLGGGRRVQRTGCLRWRAIRSGWRRCDETLARSPALVLLRGSRRFCRRGPGPRDLGRDEPAEQKHKANQRVAGCVFAD